MPYLLDGAGALVPAGQHQIEYRGNLHLGAIPSWLTGLTASNNTGATYTPTVSPAAGNIPHLLMSTSAATNRRATVAGPAFDTSLVKRLRLDIATWGGAFSEAGNRRSAALGFTDTPASNPVVEAAQFEHAHNNGTSAILHIWHGSSTAVVSRNTGRSWHGKTQYMQHTLILDFVQQEAWLLNGDQLVIGVPLGAQMPAGTLTPFVRVTTNDATANSMRLLRFDVSAEY